MNFRPLSNILTIHVSVRVTTRTCARIKIFIDDVIMSFVISLTGHRFSPRFWYVVAETILYKIHDINLYILWRHHNQIFNQRRQCIIFHICVLYLWEVTCFSKHESAWQWSLSRILVVIAPFSVYSVNFP